jgi:mRNA-degrading endonuclease toxin of MazEF toxin-antitoxin module
MVHVPPRQGEIWWVYTPGQPQDPHQPRPALVVSSDGRNQIADDCMVVPIFSAGRPGPTRVQLQAGTGGIERDSILRCEEITSLSHEFFVDGPLGATVSHNVIDRVIRAVRRAMGEVVVEP